MLRDGDQDGLGEIVVDKNTLLEKLRQNREAHAANYDVACEEYKKDALKLLTKLRKDVTDGKMQAVWPGPIVPEVHLDDYDRAISMLEYHLGGKIGLSSHAFAQFVQDEWAWSQRWRASTLAYAARSR